MLLVMLSELELFVTQSRWVLQVYRPFVEFLSAPAAFMYASHIGQALQAKTAFAQRGQRAVK